MTKAPVYLLDVNPVIARLDAAHVHHGIAKKWFATPGLKWATCPFTEAGVLRYFTRPGSGGLSVGEVTTMLVRLRQEIGGHSYLPITSDWQTLTKPFFNRLQGHNQITDAFLLGLAIQKGFVLVTFDRGFLHMAGEHQNHVLVLG